MAGNQGNQREMQRKQRRADKDRRNKRIIWIIIIIVVAILAAMKIFEVNINSVKNYFTDENGRFSITDRVVDDNFPYSLDSSKVISFGDVNNKLGILTPNSFTILNSKNAAAEYSLDHGYSNPLISTAGLYTLIYDQGANSFRLDNSKTMLYENSTQGSIYCADVAKNGSVVFATVSDEKKSHIQVVSKSLKTLVSYETSSGYVVQTAINESGSKIAFVTVNSENAQLQYTLNTMIVGSDEIKAEIKLPEGNPLRLEYSSGDIYVIGDSYLGVVSGQKKYKAVYDYGKINTICYTFTPSDDLVLVYNNYENSSDNKIVRVKPNGKIRKEAKLSGAVKSVSSSSSIISVLTNNSVVMLNSSNLEERNKLSVDDSAKAICQMGSQVFIHRQSLIDKGGEIK